MTDDRTALTKRIADVILEHSICECGEWAENFEEHCFHISQRVLAELAELDVIAWGGSEH